MKTNKLFSALAIASLVSVVLFSGCKKDDTSDVNPAVIPDQTKVMTTVSLAGASNFAVLAG